MDPLGVGGRVTVRRVELVPSNTTLQTIRVSVDDVSHSVGDSIAGELRGEVEGIADREDRVHHYQWSERERVVGERSWWIRGNEAPIALSLVRCRGDMARFQVSIRSFGAYSAPG